MNRGLIWIMGVLLLAILSIAYLWKLPSQAARKGSAIQQKWAYNMPSADYLQNGQIVSQQLKAPLALAEDGTLYVASENGTLYALSPAGQLQWESHVGAVAAAPIVGEDGTIYVTNEDQEIYAVNPDGTHKWNSAGGEFANKKSPWRACALDSAWFYTTWRGAVRAVNLASGGMEWDADDGFESAGTVSVLPNGRVVYPGAGRLNAVDIAGKNVWRYPALPDMTVDDILAHGGRLPDGNFWLDSPMAIASDGTIYAAANYQTANNPRFVAISPDGELKWEFRNKTPVTNLASPVIAADGTVYFAGADGVLYALAPTGDSKWQLQTGGSISVSPLLAQDGTIYVLNDMGLFAVSPEGKLLSKTSMNVASTSSLTLAPDGTLYIAFRAGAVKAFSTPHGPLMSSPWPKFQHDTGNTGRGATL